MMRKIALKNQRYHSQAADMRLWNLLIALIICFIPLQCSATPKSAYTWIELADGLLYTTYSFAISEKERSTIHAFQIDPARADLRVLLTKDEITGTTAESLAKSTNAKVVINGGFFTPEHRSIGLIVQDGKTLRQMHKTSWWSVFAIRKGKPSITAQQEFQVGPDVSMAIQVGPRLVIDGVIPKLKESVSNRSAIGITRDGKIIIAITTDRGISMHEMAERMGGTRYAGGLECPNAMGLDGGSSSQLYAQVGTFRLSISGLARITNGIGVFSR